MDNEGGTEKQKRAVAMKSLTAQVPYPIVQSEMFLPIIAPISPYNREWTNRFGDVCKV